MSKILIIDDVQQSIDLMRSHLQSVGHQVHTASDGHTGIKKANSIMPDLIILDLIMPRVSGLDVCKLLKKSDKTKDIIILVVTAMSSKETKNRAFDAGADEYMEKTFDKDTFLAKVRSLLRVKNLTDKLHMTYSEIREKNKEYEFQLQMAKQVQSAIIKDYDTDNGNVVLYTKYLPAQIIGGDFLDVVEVSPNRFSIFIADVSGHGVSAALLTSMVKVMYRNLIEVAQQPGELLRLMNTGVCDVFRDSSSSMYICAMNVLIDADNGQFYYATAGASPPIFVNSSLRQANELISKGRPLGIIEESVYKEECAKFNIGDCLFLYTDGLCDSFYKDSPDTFVTRLCELMLDVTEDEVEISPKELIEIIMTEFYNRKGTNNDDVTVVFCKMK